MTSKKTVSRLSRRRLARGFSLIELGIVIAVIAVLAAVVIFGRGFILAARVTKAVDASNTIRKAASTYAGVNGGSLTGVGATNQLTSLSQRALIPALPAGTTAWTVSGTAGATDAVAVADVRMGTANQNGTAANTVLIRITTQTAAMADDIRTAVKDDKNIVSGGPTVGGLACQDPNATVTTTAVNLCFFL